MYPRLRILSCFLLDSRGIVACFSSNLTQGAEQNLFQMQILPLFFKRIAGTLCVYETLQLSSQKVFRLKTFASQG